MVAQRTILQNDTIFYVDNDNGSDANDGLTAAKKTIQAMMDTMFREYDHGGVRVRVQLADSVSPYGGISTRGAWVGHYGYPAIDGTYPTFEIVGNVNDHSRTIIDGGNLSAVETVVGKSLHLDGLTLRSSGANAVHALLSGSEICIHRCTIGQCGQSAILADGTGAVIILEDNISIIGNAPQFMYADALAEIRVSPPPGSSAVTITAHGNLNFSDFFVGAARNSVIQSALINFEMASGASVTGQRWALARGGQIDTGGRNPDSLFFGNVVGGVRIGGGFCG